MLSIKNVSKKYSNNFTALSDFNLELNGGVIGLLGANGAGKSTLMKMIATVLKPSEGVITWKGQDIHKNGEELRHDLGYLPQSFGVFPNLTAVEFLKYMAALKGLNMKKAKGRISELIDLLNLSDATNRSIGNYSGGMKQRVGIAQALLNDPKILIVDEPTVGLDLNERMNFRNLINSLSKDKIIILSTHIVSDVESSDEKIVLMNKGKMICFCKNEELLNSMEGNVWECKVLESEIEDIKDKYITGNIVRRNEGMEVRVISENKPVSNSITVQPTLEDAYIYYTSGKRGENLE
ncbi:ABC transporter ATP-binding protein [Clostridium beijerinckii]|uniref:ABC-type multidrug transport system ATPase subunit n=1 Tax=Clostridium beijerinckii TaxID=1520 RepID=A0AAX0BA45_CLOBE|nr:ABC transporter ATP-binding protein [Clostridium beijerinckii]NRT92006.1 ABC-type multidrug transport system ATPase subunit [Clostridium beijerinckii]NYC71532.1 ABC-type multidrug transport system ATPase subunit [Clostridium beijerinckii]